MTDSIRVLYVDDNPHDRELVLDTLEEERSGFEVTPCADRAEFESLLKKGDWDIILSDFNILGYDGLQVIEAVQEQTPQTPVVIITGTGSEEMAAQAIKSGASDYVIKTRAHIQRLPDTLQNTIRFKKSENERLRAEKDLRRAQQVAHIGSWTYDPAAQQPIWSDEMFRIFGLAPAPEAPDYAHHREFLHPDDWELFDTSVQRAVNEGIGYDLELRIIRPDGDIRYVHSICETVHDDQGVVRELIGTTQEITEKKLAELERENLQAQLIQAQKLESVGRLAGGVAHDFNNMLGVILGRAEMALMGLKPWDPYYLDFQEIRKVAKRSAEIVRKMLAFARKQTISPKVLDLNETIEGMLRMLRRLIGENINLTWLPGKNLWPVYMDPSQMDQILANLCVNARDAIHHTGKITIETASVTLDQAYCDQHAEIVPGEYVLLAVSDDGIGMNREVLDNVFDPFFTTKEVGKGTGLGLATIYGIVKQNNGFINVYSEPGVGTTFRIYFPRHTAEGDEAPSESQAPPLKRGDETILLVEDDIEILTMTQLILEGLGYKVLAFSAPEEAVRAAKFHTTDIHLLMTDVVMPKMDGRSLSDRLLPIYPELKCLFMSGYTADVIARHGVLDEGVHFIQKPFSMLEISIKVREVLEGEVFV